MPTSEWCPPAGCGNGKEAVEVMNNEVHSQGGFEFARDTRCSRQGFTAVNSGRAMSTRYFPSS